MWSTAVCTRAPARESVGWRYRRDVWRRLERSQYKQPMAGTWRAPRQLSLHVFGASMRNPRTIGQERVCASSELEDRVVRLGAADSDLIIP